MLQTMTGVDLFEARSKVKVKGRILSPVVQHQSPSFHSEEEGTIGNGRGRLCPDI